MTWILIGIEYLPILHVPFKHFAWKGKILPHAHNCHTHSCPATQQFEIKTAHVVKHTSSAVQSRCPMQYKEDAPCSTKKMLHAVQRRCSMQYKEDAPCSTKMLHAVQRRCSMQYKEDAPCSTKKMLHAVQRRCSMQYKEDAPCSTKKMPHAVQGI